MAPAVTFTTPPFAEPYAFSGPVDAEIWLSSTAQDAQVIAILSDVDPSGASSQITAGTLVASLRSLTTAPCGAIVTDRSVYAKDRLVERWQPYTRASQTLLTPGAPTELHVEVFPTSAVIPASHSLRLTIATGDFPHETLTLSTLLSSPGVDTLHPGADHPSSITIGAVSPSPASRGVGGRFRVRIFSASSMRDDSRTV